MNRKHSFGATLIELVITIVILSIAMLAVVSVYINAIERNADPLIYARSVELGQAFLDEILTKKYDHNTPVGGVPAAGSGGGAPALSVALTNDSGETSRALYNDVDDFHNQSYTSLEFITGSGFNQYVNYQVTVVVAYAGTAVGAADNTHVKRIDVTVSNPLSTSLTFSAYKGNY